MKLIVGLGNPEKEYLHTRHNLGFMMVDLLQKKLGFEDFKEEKKFKALMGLGQLGSEKIALVKPLTFMNLSGEAVGQICQFYKIAPENCLVVYDDLDLALGTLRIRKKGGAGTHNGMKSLVEVLGENFPRVRIGIESRGFTSPKKQDTTSFVLGIFTEEEKKNLKKVLQKCLEAVKTIESEGLDVAMNLYNL